MISRRLAIIIFSVAGICSVRESATDLDPKFIATARFEDQTTAFTPKGKVQLELREVRIQVPGADGKPVTNRLLILFQPQAGAFSWDPFTDYPEANEPWQGPAFKSYRAAFLKDGRLVTFSAGRGPGPLYIQDASGKGSSLEEAEGKALSAAIKLNEPPGSLDSVQRSHVVSIDDLGREFVTPTGDAGLGETPKVTDVRWDGKHWIVTLQARWTEAITLDANYNVVSMRKVK